jgi:protein O-mannosyl-transferase
MTNSSWHQTRLKIILAVLLLSVTLMVFWQVKNHHFIDLDTRIYVTENPLVQQGLTIKGVIWAFTSTQPWNWQPLTWLSHMLDCQIYGLNPAGHHLTNVFFHLASTVLLFLFLARATQALWRSALVAALFALHPLHVESVAWVAERKDVLSTFFWMLSLCAYLRYVAKPGGKRYLLIILFFLLGLMAKPMLVTFPFVLLLLDYWPLGRFFLARRSPEKNRKIPDLKEEEPISPWYRLILEKLPLLVVSIFISLLTFQSQKTFGAAISLQQLPLTSRLLNALVAYGSYLVKFVWPVHLAIFYPHPLYPHPGFGLPLWQPLVSGLVLLSLSLGAILKGRRYPYLPVGWFWFVGMLVPVIGLVQVGTQAMADRYTYLPLIGIFLMIAWGINDLFSGRRYQKVILLLVSGTMLVAFIVCTWLQLRHWRDSISLYQHTLRVTNNNVEIHYNLANEFFKQGQVDEAITQYLCVIKIYSQYLPAYLNMGVALEKQGKFEEAIKTYQKAIQIKPDYAKAYLNLGVVYSKQGKLEEAIASYHQVLALKPDYVMAYYNLGIAYQKRGRIDLAIAAYQKVIELDQNYANAYYKLAMALKEQGNDEQARAMYQKALQLRQKPPLLVAPAP